MKERKIQTKVMTKHTNTFYTHLRIENEKCYCMCRWSLDRCAKVFVPSATNQRAIHDDPKKQTDI